MMYEEMVTQACSCFCVHLFFAGVTETDIVAPLCACKTVPRQAILKTVVRNGDPNQGLRYWSCSNYKVPFTKKQRQTDGIGESCKYFRLTSARLIGLLAFNRNLFAVS